MSHNYMRYLLIMAVFMACPLVKSSARGDIRCYQHSILAQYFGCNADKRAQNYFLSVMAHQPPSATYKGYLEYLHRARQYDTIIAFVNGRQSLFLRLIDYDSYCAFIFAYALESVGKNGKADDHFCQFASQFPQDSHLVFYACKADIRNCRYEQAQKKITELLKHNCDARGQYPFYFLQYRICCELGQYDDALSSLEHAVQLQPKFEQGWLFLAFLYEQKNDLDKALKCYKSYLKLVGGNPVIEEKTQSIKRDRKNRKEKNGR